MGLSLGLEGEVAGERTAAALFLGERERVPAVKERGLSIKFIISALHFNG